MSSTSPRLARIAFNWWSPFRGAGIRVIHIADDFRSATVEMRLRSSNRSGSGTHFGGSLFAMTDPFFAFLLRENLGDGYLVWDKAGAIEYLAPGRGRVWARMEVAEADLDHIRRMTEAGDKHLHLFKVEIRDDDGMAVARVEKMVYVRRRREGGATP
jgi:acyl-coenzyme A thioesterase PaaI-like protein